MRCSGGPRTFCLNKIIFEKGSVPKVLVVFVEVGGPGVVVDAVGGAAVVFVGVGGLLVALREGFNVHGVQPPVVRVERLSLGGVSDKMARR